MFKQLFLKFILILILELVSHANSSASLFLKFRLSFVSTYCFWPNKYYRKAFFCVLLLLLRMLLINLLNTPPETSIM